MGFVLFCFFYKIGWGCRFCLTSCLVFASKTTGLLIVTESKEEEEKNIICVLWGPKMKSQWEIWDKMSKIPLHLPAYTKGRAFYCLLSATTVRRSMSTHARQAIGMTSLFFIQNCFGLQIYWSDNGGIIFLQSLMSTNLQILHPFWYQTIIKVSLREKPQKMPCVLRKTRVSLVEKMPHLWPDIRAIHITCPGDVLIAMT